MTNDASTPLISVLIPMYNSARYIREALESVVAQTYRPVEIIVVDDGSTDGGGAIVAEFAAEFGVALRCELQEQSGASAARNRAVELATGEFLAFLDADDCFRPNKLQLQMEAFVRDPGLDMVFGHVSEFVSGDLARDAAESVREPIDDAPWRMPSLMLVRRESFLRVGPFAADLRAGEGIDWYARAKEMGLNEQVPPVIVLERRLHDANSSMRDPGSRPELLRVLRRSLDRRREAGGAGEETGEPPKPLISVLVSVYNAAPYVGEAIESVLAQTHRPLELIVVDDGSTDGSGDIVKAYGDDVRYEYHERLGIGAARNRAVELARGELFAFLDADDRFVPDKLERQLAQLDADPQLDMVFGHVREFISPDVEPSALQSLRQPVDDHPFRMPSLVLVRREAFFRAGLYSTDLRVGVGVDWYTRARACGLKEAVPPVVVLERRLHASNNGILEADKRQQYLRVLKQSLERRRRLEQPDGTS